MELLDDVQMDACIKYSKLEGYDPKPTIFFEFHGTEASAKEQAETVQEIAEEFGGSAFKWTAQMEDRNKLWQARHDAYYAAIALRSGCQGWATDVCVPVSRLAECINETKADLEGTNLLSPLVGHVGDGNFHLLYIVDPENAENLTENIENLDSALTDKGNEITKQKKILFILPLLEDRTHYLVLLQLTLNSQL